MAIGNRHLPCQIEESRILIQENSVIKEMIINLHGNENYGRKI